MENYTFRDLEKIIVSICKLNEKNLNDGKTMNWDAEHMKTLLNDMLEIIENMKRTYQCKSIDVNGESLRDEILRLGVKYFGERITPAPNLPHKLLFDVDVNFQGEEYFYQPKDVIMALDTGMVDKSKYSDAKLWLLFTENALITFKECEYNDGGTIILSWNDQISPCIFRYRDLMQLSCVKDQNGAVLVTDVVYDEEAVESELKRRFRPIGSDDEGYFVNRGLDGGLSVMYRSREEYEDDEYEDELYEDNEFDTEFDNDKVSVEEKLITVYNSANAMKSLLQVLDTDAGKVADLLGNLRELSQNDMLKNHEKECCTADYYLEQFIPSVEIREFLKKQKLDIRYMANIIYSAPCSLKQKLKGFKRLLKDVDNVPEGNEKNEFVEDTKQFIAYLENLVRELHDDGLFSVEEISFDLEVSKYTGKIIMENVSYSEAKKTIDLSKNGTEHENNLKWHVLRKWEENILGERDLKYTWLIVEGEAWFGEESNSFYMVKSEWFDGMAFQLRSLQSPLSNFTTPYKAGDIVEIDDYPFGPKSRLLIISVGKTNDSIIAVGRNSEGLWIDRNLCDRDFYHNSFWISPLYSMHRYDHDLEGKDQALYGLRNYFRDDMRRYWDFRRNPMTDLEVEELIRNNRW